MKAAKTLRVENPHVDSAKKYVARPEEDMKRIEEIVKKAMGYSAERRIKSR